MTLTVGQLNRVVKYLDESRQLSAKHGVEIDSYSALFLRIDSEDFAGIEVRQELDMSWVVSL